MIKLTITGDVPSKKNSRQAIYVKGRTIFIANKNHQNWHKQAISQLHGINPVIGQIKRLEMILYASTKRKADLSNRFESIADLLVDVGILEDDNYFIVPEVLLKFGGQDKNNPRCEITIYELLPEIQDAPPEDKEKS